MARWEDWIGDSHKPAFSCDHDFLNFSLVLVPSLPVSLLCVASLLRWYSLDNVAGIVVIWGWKAKRNILNDFKAEDMKKSVLIPAAFLVGTLGWCQPALPTYQRYLQEKMTSEFLSKKRTWTWIDPHKALNLISQVTDESTRSRRVAIAEGEP